MLGIIAGHAARLAGWPAGRPQAAQQEALIERGLVDRIVQRLAHAHILHRRIARAFLTESDRHDRHGGTDRRQHAGIFEHIDIVDADVAGDLDLAGQKRLHAARVVGQIDEDQGGRLWACTPGVPACAAPA